MTSGTKLRLLGFVLLVAGGAVAYATRHCLSTEGTDRTVFIGGGVAGIVGLAMLIGIKGLKAVGREALAAGRSQPRTKL